jgi:hypothetical protein
MRAQWSAGEERNTPTGRRHRRTLRGLAVAAVVCAAIGGQMAVGHLSSGGGVGGIHGTSSGGGVSGVQVASTDPTIQPDSGGLGGPGVP